MSHHFAILSPEPPSEKGPCPLGARAEIVASLGTMNTLPQKPGENILWGPGVKLEMVEGEDPLKQILLTITEEEIAWLVIARMMQAFGWRVVDLETGEAVELVEEEE